MVLYSASLLGFWAPLIYLPRGGRAKSRTESTQAAFPIGAPDVTTSQTRRGKRGLDPRVWDEYCNSRSPLWVPRHHWVERKSGIGTHGPCFPLGHLKTRQEGISRAQDDQGMVWLGVSAEYQRSERREKLSLGVLGGFLGEGLPYGNL